MLTDLGYRLADVAKASDEARPKLVAECVEIAKKITAETKKNEQCSAEQPATASESKPEGEKKPKPESEGRSQ